MLLPTRKYKSLEVFVPITDAGEQDQRCENWNCARNNDTEQNGPYTGAVNLCCFHQLFWKASIEIDQKNQVKDWESSAEDQADHIVDHAVIDHGDVPRNRSSVEQHTKNDDPHNHIFRMIFIR